MQPYNICLMQPHLHTWFLYVSPNIMAKANGFLPSLFFWPFLLLSVVSPCLLCPPCPLHPSVHSGTSAGVGCVGPRLALLSGVAGGSWTESRLKEESRRKRQRGEEREKERDRKSSKYGCTDQWLKCCIMVFTPPQTPISQFVITFHSICF